MTTGKRLTFVALILANVGLFAGVHAVERLGASATVGECDPLGSSQWCRCLSAPPIDPEAGGSCEDIGVQVQVDCFMSSHC